MTDLETMRGMLTRAGLPFTEETIERTVPGLLYGEDSLNPEPELPPGTYGQISVERGYIGFVSVFTFRPDGSLVDVSAWE